MKSSLVLALASLAFVGAAPAIHLPKREVVYHVVTDIIVETVDIVTTVWIPAPSPAAAAAAAADDGHQFLQPAPAAAEDQTTTTLTSTSTSTTTHTLLPVSTTPPAPSSPAAVKPAAVVPKPAVAAVAPSPPAPAPSPPSAAAASQSQVDSTSGSYPSVKLPGATVSNGCTPGTPCVGDITYYDPSIGDGACGTVHAASEKVVAVAVGMMGSLSSGLTMNPLCGRSVHITNPHNGKEVEALVVDKCYGCAIATSLDLSNGAFDELADEATGRVSGIEWYWV